MCAKIWTKEKKLRIVMMPDVKKFLNTLSPKERKELEKGMKQLADNPYRGDPLWGGWKTRIWNKWMWMKTEIKRRMG